MNNSNTKEKTIKTSLCMLRVMWKYRLEKFLRFWHSFALCKCKGLPKYEVDYTNPTRLSH